MRPASLPPQSFTKAATSPSRRARASASRLSGAGDCEQPVKIRNPQVRNIDEWRFIFVFSQLDVSTFWLCEIIHRITSGSAGGVAVLAVWEVGKRTSPFPYGP